MQYLVFTQRVEKSRKEHTSRNQSTTQQLLPPVHAAAATAARKPALPAAERLSQPCYFCQIEAAASGNFALSGLSFNDTCDIGNTMHPSNHFVLDLFISLQVVNNNSGIK